MEITLDGAPLHGNVIAPDEIRRKFVPQDDLQERIRAIEILLTEV